VRLVLRNNPTAQDKSIRDDEIITNHGIRDEFTPRAERVTISNGIFSGGHGLPVNHSQKSFDFRA